MTRSFFVAVALFFALAQLRSEAAVTLQISSSGETTTNGDSSADFTLDFSLFLDNNFLNPSTPAALTGIDLFSYSNFNDDTFLSTVLVNADIFYDLDLTIADTTEGTLGTVDIGGSSNGGGSSFRDTFIRDDLNKVKVNGVNVPFTGGAETTNPDKAKFFFQLTSGFLNVRLFDPNTDDEQALGNVGPEQGLALDLVFTTTAPLQGYTRAASAAVPEPSSALLLLGVGAFSTLFARRRVAKR